MEKKEIITIAGKPGSGKSTTSKLIAAELGFTHFSSGDLFRSIAHERGIDVYEINVLAETEKEIDYLVDEKLRIMGAEQDKMVIDSRMAWHWMPYSFRVYLDLDLQVAATRIIANLTEERLKAESISSDPVTYAVTLKKRLESESKRYANLYQVNPYDTDNYDLVVNTYDLSPKEVADLVIQSYQAWRAA